MVYHTFSYNYEYIAYARFACPFHLAFYFFINRAVIQWKTCRRVPPKIGLILFDSSVDEEKLLELTHLRRFDGIAKCDGNGISYMLFHLNPCQNTVIENLNTAIVLLANKENKQKSSVYLHNEQHYLYLICKIADQSMHRSDGCRCLA